jgi:hypothetical protein
MKRDPNRYPRGWNRKRVEAVIEHFDDQTGEQAIAEADAMSRAPGYTMMSVPTELVCEVFALIARHEQENKRDLALLRRARREDEGNRGVRWEEVQRQLGIGGKRRPAKKKKEMRKTA